MNRKDVERIILQTEKLTQNDEKLYADSVLRVAVEENKDAFHISRWESEIMFDSLRELMKEDLDEALEKGTEIGKEIGKEELILGSLKKNRTAEEIADFLGIPLDEVKAVEKKL